MTTVPLETGQGGLPKIVLRTSSGARAEVYLYGAHVTSWIPAGGAERLFLSDHAEFCAGKAIRGGAPVCFPQFSSQGPLPPHGFARVNSWTLVEVETNGDHARAILQLRDSEATRALWPHAFLAEVTVTLGESDLAVALALTNTGAAPFTFTGALHTYLRIDDLEALAVENLRGLHYIDALDGRAERVETMPEVRLTGGVNRIYLNAPPRVLVREPGRVTEVQAEGFPDVVVWNPGARRSPALADLGPEGYRQMVCVEAAAAGAEVQLPPSAGWRGAQRLTVI